MMQSLAGIDPVFACGNDVSFDSSERLATVVSFASSPNPVAAERFQLAMAFGGTVKSSWRGEFSERLNAEGERVQPEGRMSARREIFISLKHLDSVPTRRGEDASPCHDVNASKDFPKDAVTLSAVSESLPLDRMPLEQAERMPAESAPLESYPMPGAPSEKVVSVKRLDVSSDCICETETGGVVMDCAVEEKPPEVKDRVVGAFISPERSESQVQFNAGSEHVLPENVKPADVFNRVLPGKAVLVGRDGGIALQNQEGMPVRRQGDALPYQNIGKVYEMPSDGNEPVLVIAPASLPIELPAAAVHQQSAAAVATPDTVKMFVAAAEAVADAILVSSGFENGEGRILVRLQPEVLGGSEIQITVKSGTLTVVVNPASQDVQTIVEANRTQFEQHLAEKVHSWRVAVAVRRGDKTNERV
jgi:hypothetical protein